MALDTRRCFWFGTEERAGFFATPLKGADSSPSAWSTDGTLLNGGGYGFNSFGSHKRYSYEWPQSSSPETAQMMKSYRDGTYGRGLLYFLEPGIYKTNILPAAWADPSMAVNNEAPSLVYNIEPIAVPTSGGSNLNLPVTSAQYDLSTTPAQTTPTPDTSVFLPVPTGHTLLLGAFYSATGTGGIFATPVNNNGTLGANVKLTEKPNSDTDVVTDQFSGDIKGVRLWVGRSDATASTVTIAAMCGRLIETSDLPVYGTWTEQYRNFVRDPGFTNVANYPATGGVTRSVLGGRLTVTSAGVSAVRAGVTHNLANIKAAGTYSISVDVQSNSVNFTGARMYLYDTATNTLRGSVNFAAPTTETRITATATASGVFNQVYIEFYGTAIVSGNSGTFGRPVISSGGTPRPWFYPGADTTDVQRSSWVGVADLSESTWETRTRTGTTVKLDNLSRDPWLGGQGHSGCRFLGTPSYVNNGPVEGGRVGFAASFVEVGSWVYG